MGIREILLAIGLMFSNPLFPDFGMQFFCSLLIGLVLPESVINPIDSVIRKIPGVNNFVKMLGKNKKIRTIIPRILVGYFFTYLIGWFSLLLSVLSWPL